MQKFYAGEGADVTPRMICVNVPEGGKGSCDGDSGGALVLMKSRKQVGIVSWAFGCAKKDYPTAYANIADKEIQDFIDRELRHVAMNSSSNGSEV